MIAGERWERKRERGTERRGENKNYRETEKEEERAKPDELHLMHPFNTAICPLFCVSYLPVFRDAVSKNLVLDATLQIEAKQV